MGERLSILIKHHPIVVYPICMSKINQKARTKKKARLLRHNVSNQHSICMLNDFYSDNKRREDI
jgi:hypothetical protein